MLQEQYLCWSCIKVSEFYGKLCLLEVDEQDFVVKATNSPIHALIDNDGKEMPPNLNSLIIRSSSATVRDCNHGLGAFSQMYLQNICSLQFILVLDLTGEVEYLPDALGDLVHLRYLGLNSSRIKKLPRTISNLQNLQTLKVDNCSKLPIEILNIKQLRHLLLSNRYHYDGGIRVPRGIETLVNLHTSSGVYAGTGIASELSTLIQLRKFDVQDVSEDHSDELFAAIMKVENLVSLSLSAEKDTGGTLLPETETFSPPPHIQEFRLQGGLIEIPKWLPSIENLTTLSLCHSNLLEPIFNSSVASQVKTVPAMGRPIRQSSSVESFRKAGGSPKLETLTIASSKLVEGTEIVAGAFPSLRHLHFWNRVKLRFLPEGLEHISTIEESFLTHLHGDHER